jgi:hypothetical protein
MTESVWLFFVIGRPACRVRGQMVQSVHLLLAAGTSPTRSFCFCLCFVNLTHDTVTAAATCVHDTTAFTSPALVTVASRRSLLSACRPSTAAAGLRVSEGSKPPACHGHRWRKGPPPALLEAAASDVTVHFYPSLHFHAPVLFVLILLKLWPPTV